ncbi:MAG: enoyl-CoA hydratase [Dehalococcoidia bacterium]
MTYQSLLLEKDSGLATVTLNRPEKMNAISPELVDELIEVIDETERDDEVRAVLITGAGRAFCAGGDVETLLSGTDNPAEVYSSSLKGAKIISGIRNASNPWIAAVNGPAVGAGCNLAIGCDIIIAASSATFSLAFMKLGLHPDTGGIYLPTRLLGPARALELVLTGKTIGAEEAERIGLINLVVPDDELAIRSKEMALKLAHGPSRSIAMAKSSIYSAASMDMESILESEARAISLTMATDDAREGIRAFLEKRKPQFKGK